MLIEQKRDSNINAFDDSKDYGDLVMPVENNKDNKSDSDKTVHNAVGAIIVNTNSTTKHMFREVKRRQECHVTHSNTCQNNCAEFENDSGRGDDLIQNWIHKSDHLRILNEPDRTSVSETNSMTKIDSVFETSDVEATNSPKPNMNVSTTDNDGQDINQLEGKTGTREQLKGENITSRKTGTKDGGAIYNDGSVSSDLTTLHCKDVTANDCNDIKANKEVNVKSINNNIKLFLNHHNDNYCSTCNSSFTRKSSLVRHNQKFHRDNNFETSNVLIEQKSKSTINAFVDSNGAGDLEMPFENDKDNKRDSEKTFVANIVKTNNTTKHMLREVKCRQKCHVTPTKKCQNSSAEAEIDSERGDDLIQNWIHKSNHLKILNEPDRISVSETSSRTKKDSVFKMSDTKSTNSQKPNMNPTTTDNDGRYLHKTGTHEQPKGVSSTSRSAGNTAGGVSADLSALHCKDVNANKAVKIESISNNTKLLIKHHNDNYCSTCSSSFTRKSSLVRHNRKFHRDNNFETPNVLIEQNSKSTINAFDELNDAGDLEMPFENDKDNKSDSDNRVHNAVYANVVKTSNTTKHMLREVKSRQECHETPTKKCQNSCAETEIDSGRGDDLLQSWIHKSGHLKIINEADRISVSETNSKTTKDSVFKTSDIKATNSPKPKINPTTTDNDGRYLHKTGTHEQPKGVSSTSRSAGNTDGGVLADLTALHCEDVNANKAANVESVSNDTKLLINHHNDNYCSTCNSFYARKSSLVRHNRKFHSTKHVLKGSTSKFNDRLDTFSKVKKETKKSKYGEFDAEKSFRLIQKVRTNSRGSDKNSNLSNADLYTTNLGRFYQRKTNDSNDIPYLSKGESFVSDPAIPNWKRKIYECSVCSSKIRTFSSFKAHLLIHTGVKQFRCDTCKYYFRRKSNLNRHMRMVHCKCHVCFEQFTRYTELAKHIREAHREKKNTELKCNVCSKQFTRKDILERHIMVHTREKPNQCEVCGKFFRGIIDLKRHVKRHGEKLYACEICGKKISTLAVFKTHLLMHTGGGSDIICDICGARFRWATSLRQHKLTHTGLRDYKCDLCDRTFRTKWGLDIHIKGHLDIRMFPCSVCNRSFLTKRKMDVHMETHSTERSYQCELCNKILRSKSALGYHMFSHSGTKPFSCERCGQKFKRATNLRTHMLIHEGKKPHSCVTCGATFRQKTSLKLHMKKIHDTVNTCHSLFKITSV